MPTTTAIPALRVSDLEVSRRFYQQILQFKFDWVWRPNENAPAFAQISREGICLYLTERDPGGYDGLTFLYVEDVDLWYRHLLQHEWPVEKLPHNETWGNREMTVRDPDGNCLRICTPL